MLWLIGITGMLAGQTLWLFTRWLDGKMMSLWAGLVAALLLVNAVVQTLAWRRAPASRAAVDYLVQMAKASCLCASCGYNLRNLPTEPDHCTLCPECGAAWRLPTTPNAPPSPRA